MFVNKSIAKIYIQFKVKSDINPQKNNYEEVEQEEAARNKRMCTYFK